MILTTLLLGRLTASGIVARPHRGGHEQPGRVRQLSALNASLLSGQPPDRGGPVRVLSVAASAFDAAFDVRMVVGAAVMLATAAADLAAHARAASGDEGNG